MTFMQIMSEESSLDDPNFSWTQTETFNKINKRVNDGTASRVCVLFVIQHIDLEFRF